MGNVATFIQAVAGHWLSWVGLLLMVEPYLEGAFPSAAACIRWLLADERRKRFFRFAGVLALLVACFQVWDDEHRAHLADAVQSPYHWAMLTSDESTKLRESLRDLPPQGEGVQIVCDGDSCDDLAQSIRDVFRELHWTVYCCSSLFSGVDDGFHLWAANDQPKAVADKIERATSGRIKVDTSGTWKLDPARYLLQIMIGAKL